MSRSRISRFESEPLDPATTLRHWESIEFSDSTEQSTATQSYPYHGPPAVTPYQRTRNDQPFSSPEISPPLRSQAWGRPRGPRVVSMVSPQSPDFPRTATSGPLGYSPLDALGGPRLSTLITETSPNLLLPSSIADRNSASYSIPPPPKPPSIPLDVDDGMDYDRFKTSVHNAIDHEGPYSDQGSWPVRPGAGLGSNPGRNKSLARRFSSRIMSTVRGRPKSGWDYKDRTGGSRGIDEESLRQATRSGGYSKVDEMDETQVPVGVDLGFFTVEHVPAAAAQAMQDHKMDVDMVYTDTGDAFDLSNFSGLDADKDSDTFSTHRAANIQNGKDTKSYYFVPNRDIPNWKPLSMRTWFISFLLFISLLLLVGAEALYQLSNRGFFRGDKKKPGILSFKTVNDLDIIQFAMWKYMPTVVGVIYGILWKITDTEVKRTEPYYQLSRGMGTGALAASTLNIEYQTFWSLLVPVEALRHKQWVVGASSLASFVAFAIVPTLLSVFVEISPSQKERQRMIHNGTKKSDSDIEKLITVASGFTRILEGTLIFVLVFGTYMLIMLKRRRSGLMGDPSGIAGVAAMANKSHILMDFQGLDMASEEKIHKQLNKRTYVLHKGSLWQAQFLKESERDNQAPKPMNAHPLLLRLKGGLPFLAFLIIFAGVLPPMAIGTRLNIVIDKTPWILTLVSVTIKSLWEIVEKDMRMLEPFWILYKRHAHSSVLTLDYSGTIPGWLPIKAAFKGHFFLAWVGFVSVLVEILTVAMGSLDYSGGEESGTSFKVSFALAMLILATLILTMILVLLLRRKTFLPRQPGTISSVLAFIHQSHMLVDFEGTEEATTAQRRDKLAKIGKKYGFGWFQGRDGNRHLGIDCEELLGSYKFGDDSHRTGTMRATDIGGWETFEGR